MGLMSRIIGLHTFARSHIDLWLDVNAKHENEAREPVLVERRRSRRARKAADHDPEGQAITRTT